MREWHLGIEEVKDYGPTDLASLSLRTTTYYLTFTLILHLKVTPHFYPDPSFLSDPLDLGK